MVTFGLRFAGLKDFGGNVRGNQARVFQDMVNAGTQHGAVSQDLVMQCFMAAGLSDSVICAVDCRQFFDPAGHTRHVGFHSDVVCGVVSHRSFASWVAGVVRGLANCVQQAVEGGHAVRGLRVTLAIYCKSGRHRSVAAAAVLASCLATSQFRKLNLVLGQQKHLAAGFWSGRTCSGCAECHEVDAKKQRALRDARKVWAESWAALLGENP